MMPSAEERGFITEHISGEITVSLSELDEVDLMIEDARAIEAGEDSIRRDADALRLLRAEQEAERRVRKIRRQAAYLAGSLWVTAIAMAVWLIVR